MSEQPEALRVADWLERRGERQQHLDAARLLREQHEGIEQLGAQLSADWEMISEHRAEIEELREANEALRRDAELGRWIREETPPIEEIAARVDGMEDET